TLLEGGQLRLELGDALLTGVVGVHQCVALGGVDDDQSPTAQPGLGDRLCEGCLAVLVGKVPDHDRHESLICSSLSLAGVSPGPCTRSRTGGTISTSAMTM